MVIPVNENWQLRSEDNCVILEKKRINEKKGNREYWVPEGYYPTFQLALVGMFRREISVPGTVKDLIQKIDDVEKWIRGLDFPYPEEVENFEKKKSGGAK